MIHVVAYDLKEPNDTSEDYQRVISAIKTKFSSWCHIEKSVWLIDTPDGAGAVRDTLKTYMHDKDVLFVGRLSGNWASWNFGDERNEWLKARKF